LFLLGLKRIGSYAVKTAGKYSIGFSFIEKFRDGHSRVALGAAGQVFYGQVNDLRVATLCANHLNGFEFATLHDDLPRRRY
jgi:hypothetical protein